MLSTCFQELRARVRTIEDSLRAHDAIRELLALGFAPLLLPTVASRDAALRMKYHAPASTEWRELDHSATMTTLYAAYERFVHDLLTEWLSQLPQLYSRYGELSQNLRTKYREGVAHILHYADKWERYKTLSVIRMLEDLATALAERQPFTLLPEAFFTEDQNLRKERLESLFVSVGLENPWGWIEGHHAVVDFVLNVRGEGNTVEKELLDFIRYRNDAAHGFVSDILGIPALLQICQFIICICQALTEFVRRGLLKRYLALGKATEIGRVTEVYQRGTVIVAKMNACKVHVQDELFFLGKRRCALGVVQSLKDNDVDKPEIYAADQQEVGFALDVAVKRKLKIIQISEGAGILDYVI